MPWPNSTSYAGCSWSGNSSEVDSLDIALNWDVNNLSSWGDFLINSDNGLRATAQTASVFNGQSSSSLSSSSSVSSSVGSSSSVNSSVSSSASSAASGQQCNWYGTLYPLCEDTQSGWGWENNESCVGPSSCQSQPAPYGIVGESGSSSSAPSSSSASVSSSVSSSVNSSSVSSSSSSSSEPEATGNCEYVVSNEWSSGYTAAIRIHNEGSAALNGWSVHWEYSDGSQVTNGWNAQIEGSNPYSATDMGWNGTVQPGQSVEFGFQVSKGGSAAAVPAVTGGPCD